MAFHVFLFLLLSSFIPRVTQRDRESAEKEPAKGYEQRVCPHRVTGKREIQLA